MSVARPKDWTHIYLSNQQIAAGLGVLGVLGALCPESALELLVQIKNTKLIPLTMPHAGTSHRMSRMCSGMGGYGIVTGVGVNPEKTGSVRLNESELS